MRSNNSFDKLLQSKSHLPKGEQNRNWLNKKYSDELNLNVIIN